MKKPITDDRLRNVRAWAAARPDMSGSDVIVAAIDELLERRVVEPTGKWVETAKRAPTEGDAQFGMVYVYYPDGLLLPQQPGDYAELTRWEHVAERPDHYPWWCTPPLPPSSLNRGGE
jgi:hypothetical protein